MDVITSTDLRNNLKSVLDKVTEDSKVLIVTRKEGDHAVILSKDHYDSLMETLYLLSSTTNAERLNESISQLNQGNLICRDLLNDTDVHSMERDFIKK